MFKKFLLPIYRKIKPSPVQVLVKELKKEGVFNNKINALEVFGKDGEWVTKDYANLTSSLEIWEIDSVYEEKLRNNFPNATIKITDSFSEINRTQRKYNFIVIDNPMSTYDKYCEHFELFPNVFRIMEDSSTLIVNIIPKISDDIKREVPYIFNEEQLKRRSAFYNTENPDNVTISEMVNTYGKVCENNGFSLKKYFTIQRTFVYFLVLYLQKESNLEDVS